jgi:ElaB/YqjD/DUF883 family membrane-anchored ribosome-binding protein
MELSVRGNTHPSSTTPNSMEGTLDKASTSAHAAVNSMVVAADEAARNVKPAIDRVAAMAHHAVDAAAGAAAPTADWMAEQGACLKAAQGKMVASTRGYVSAHPLKAIGIAVVAGFLLSRVIR